MKVLIVEPGKYPREADIEHTLEAEQAVVGGTIEAVYPWRDSACIVCNDNGIAENLPLNRMLGDYDIIHGTFFVCGLTSNDFTDLTPQQIRGALHQGAGVRRAEAGRFFAGPVLRHGHDWAFDAGGLQALSRR